MYPVRLQIVPTDHPLTLAGPTGDRSAVGLEAHTDHSGYRIGPTLVAAKLNRVDPAQPGEGGVFGIGGADLPNDEPRSTDPPPRSGSGC
ncbi:MAG: hypothetical protein BGP03_31580 [Pseudonocardia sp. 73-21]|nr:MAG: hypothetical protein BGP03_31580 [Pseudonocardia sp. 73-21]